MRDITCTECEILFVREPDQQLSILIKQNSQFVEIFHQTGPSLQLTVLVSYSKIWMKFCEFCR